VNSRSILHGLRRWICFSFVTFSVLFRALSQIIREYPSTDTGYPTYPPSLWEQLVALELFSHPAIVHENLETRYAVTVAEVGPYGADSYLSSHLTPLLADLTRKHQYDYLATQGKFKSSSGLLSDGTQENLEAMSIDSDITELSSTLIQVEAVLDKFRHSVSFDKSFALEPEWLSPKLRVLVTILVERRSSSFQGIIFVEQRQIASTLAWILPVGQLISFDARR
jgi:endoribonuclease Dicer